MPQAGRFTEEEDAFIRENYPRLGCTAVARHLKRRTGTVSSRAAILGIRKIRRTAHRFTPEEDAFLRERAGKQLAREIAGQLGRPLTSIWQRAAKLGFSLKVKGNHGGYTDTKGYPVVEFPRKSLEPRDKRQWQREHTVVARGILGRDLDVGECVHHINIDKHDNRPENLHVFAGNSEHLRAHASLNALVKPLLDDGIIAFNRDTERYELCERSRRNAL